MKISIVTISYNQAPFLEKAMLSVFEQGYPGLQYIIVDSGSTDGSRKIIERYHNQFKQVILSPDSGPADGLNKGFQYATGDIYSFLNSDDMLEAGSLSFVSRFFKSHPDVDVLSGNGKIIDEHGSLIRRFFSDRYSLKKAAYGASILCQPSTFFRASIFKRTNGFNAENLSNWDAELYVDMALKGARFRSVQKFLGYYRIHGDSITGSGKLDELHKNHQKKMYRKIFRKNPSRLYTFLAFCSQLFRKLLNPADTYERLLYGPIYRSK